MSRQTQYDPQVIQFMVSSDSEMAVMGTGELSIGAIAGAIIGGLVGVERGFMLRLRAQNALCQVAIEQNTRALSNHRTGH